MDTRSLNRSNTKIPSPKPRSRGSSVSSSSSSSYDGEVYEEIKEAFKHFDKDGDGAISIDELDNMMRNAGQYISQKELKQMMEETDENGDSSIDEKEFLKVMKDRLNEVDIK